MSLNDGRDERVDGVNDPVVGRVITRRYRDIAVADSVAGGAQDAQHPAVQVVSMLSQLQHAPAVEHSRAAQVTCTNTDLQ